MNSIPKETSKNNNKTLNDKKFGNLEPIGFDTDFQTSYQQIPDNGFSPARVIEVNKSNYKVSNGKDEIYAELSGKMMFNTESSLDYPTVGDWVQVQYFDDNTLAIIHHLLPRKSVLKRKDPGKSVDYQLIAANIDYAIIMQAADANFNLNRLERYLVMVNDSNIQPIVVLSKTDLLSKEELEDIEASIARFQNKFRFLPLSNVTGDGLDTLNQVLESGKTYCLMGSSGVGKTSLLNNLVGENLLQVSHVRASDSKGRHTTVKRQLLQLESGAIFIDTPGMRELGNFGVDTGLEETFDEIYEYGKQCRFKDCTHVHEKGCAVIDAVEQDLIDNERYQNYLRIRKEAAFYEMSVSEKRKKDKTMAKVIKNYYKTQRKK